MILLLRGHCCMFWLPGGHFSIFWHTKGHFHMLFLPREHFCVSTHPWGHFQTRLDSHENTLACSFNLKRTLLHTLAPRRHICIFGLPIGHTHTLFFLPKEHFCVFRHPRVHFCSSSGFQDDILEWVFAPKKALLHIFAPKEHCCTCLCLRECNFPGFFAPNLTLKCFFFLSSCGSKTPKSYWLVSSLNSLYEEIFHLLPVFKLTDSFYLYRLLRGNSGSDNCADSFTCCSLFELHTYCWSESTESCYLRLCVVF